MVKIPPLTTQDLQTELATLANWSVCNGKLHREFSFDDFVAAFGFMTQVAILAETMQHHPEWCNLYNRVTIDLVTHDADNAISAHDITLARKINALLG